MQHKNELLIKIILEEISYNSRVTEKYIANKYYYSDRTIRRYFRYLRQNKIIKKHGNGKCRQWKLL